jgi:hypothetical protein
LNGSRRGGAPRIERGAAARTAAASSRAEHGAPPRGVGLGQELAAGRSVGDNKVDIARQVCRKRGGVMHGSRRRLGLTELARRITGFSTPFFGVQWTPPANERDTVREFVTFLEDRRVLFTPYELEVEGQVERSVHAIRRRCTESSLHRVPSRPCEQYEPRNEGSRKRSVEKIDRGCVVEHPAYSGRCHCPTVSTVRRAARSDSDARPRSSPGA